MPSIAKNTTFMTLSSIGQKIIAFVYFALIARSVGAEGTGKYFIALSFTTIMVVFVDLGFTNVLVRESAKVKEKIQAYFSTVLSVKILLGVLAYIALVIVINLLGYEVELRHMIYLSGLTMLFDSLHLSIYGVLRAIGNLKFEAISVMISQFLSLVLGGTFLFFHLPIIFLILAFTIPSFLNACYATFFLTRTYHIRVRPAFDKKIFVYLGKIAIPFALAAVFARVYSYIDSILLQRMVGNAAAGWYSIPYKITYAFQFVPLALVAAVYPRFSEYYVTDRERLAHIFEECMKYLLIIAFPIAFGIAALAPQIIHTLFSPEYAPSVLPLRILVMSLIFSFISFPIGAFLNACHKQVTQTTIVGGVMVLNIILNLLLIPRLEITGAALAALFGNILLTVLGYLVVPSITKVSHAFLLKTFLQLFFCSFVMAVCAAFIGAIGNLILAILVAVVVYPSLLFVTKVVSKQEVKDLITLIRK